MLKEVDPQIWEAIEREKERQKGVIELIASENFTSKAVLEAMGSVLTNKYAEGYPYKRYYGGCENVDIVESIAIKRAKELFSAEHANVQPHSGSQANMAVYFAELEPGDTMLSMNLAHGGHLTHGSPVNFSGRLYNVIHYGVNPETGIIEYDMVRDLAEKHRPKIIVAGASAYPRIIDFEKFSSIAKEYGAKLVVDMAHIAGLVAAGVHPSPIPHSDYVTSTTHKTLRGPRGGFVLCREEHAKRLNSRVFPGMQGGPLMHVIAAKAVCFKEAMSEGFREYQKRVVKNAEVLAETLKEGGLNLVSGGTDNHLILVDLRNKGLTGKQVEERLEEAGITVNKNMIPDDPQKPFVTSGIRIGTPAVTSRGMGPEEMRLIGSLICEILEHIDSDEVIKRCSEKVKELTSRFYLPGI